MVSLLYFIWINYKLLKKNLEILFQITSEKSIKKIIFCYLDMAIMFQITPTIYAMSKKI